MSIARSKGLYAPAQCPGGPQEASEAAETVEEEPERAEKSLGRLR